MNTAIEKPPDTTKPAASITSPAAGATVSNTVTVSATASDNVGVAGVQFTLDGASLGSEDISSPYSVSWDTRVSQNGAHVLSAVVRDAAGNLGTAGNVSVTVNNIAAGPTPVASYKLQEGAGTTTADGSANGNSGTLASGAAWTNAGKYGNAVTFNGASGYITVVDSNLLDLRNTGTIEAWVRLEDLNRWQGFIAKGSANNNAVHNYALQVNNANRFVCILGNGSSSMMLSSTVVATRLQFTHVACVWNGSQVQLYLNGALNASMPQTLIPAINTAPVYIGQFGGNTDRLNGIVDEVRIYNQALSPAQVQSDMNSPL